MGQLRPRHPILPPRPDLRPARLDVLAAVAAGGAVGAVARYGLSVTLPHDAGAFPWSTFGINVVGCLLIGVVMAAQDLAGRPHRLVRPFLGVGVLGGFTTFSTYAVDVHELLAHGAVLTALAYGVGTVVAALVAVEAGLAITRAAARRPTAAPPAGEER